MNILALASPQDLDYIEKYIDKSLLSCYLSKNKDFIPPFESCIIEECDETNYELATKEISRALYFKNRNTDNELIKRATLSSFFGELPSNYMELLEENAPFVKSFEKLYENVKRYFDDSMILFNSLDDALYLDKKLLNNFIEHNNESNILNSFIKNSQNPLAKYFRKNSKDVQSQSDYANEIDQEVLKLLNIYLMSIYLQKHSKTYHFIDKEMLNMYQGFELELDFEESLSALVHLQESSREFQKNSSWIKKLIIKWIY